MNTATRFALRVVVLGIIFYFVGRLYDGISIEADTSGPLGATGTYLWVGFLFALVNAIVGPVLRLLSLPLVVLTLGLFLIVINAALLAITAGISDRLQVDGVTGAVVGGVIIAVFSWVAELALPIRSKD